LQLTIATSGRLRDAKSRISNSHVIKNFFLPDLLRALLEVFVR
jgi:hypothetical protein